MTLITLSDALPDLPKPDSSPIDWDAVATENVRIAIQASRQAIYNAACPLEYRETDLKRLERNTGPIGQVLGWQYGKKGLLLSGPSGRGKTRASWMLIRRLMCEESRDVALYVASEWFSKLDNQVRFGRDEAESWVHAVAKRPIVFIDDWGQQAVQSMREGWAEAWFFRFLDIRIGNGLPVIITTNLTASQIGGDNEDSVAVNGHPLIRRLVDLCDVVKFK